MPLKAFSMFIPEGTLFEESGAPAGEPAGESTGNFQVLQVSTLNRDWYSSYPHYLLISNLFCICMLTIAAADRRSLNIASSGQSQGLRLVDIHPKWRAATIQDLAQALWLWADNTCKLCAACLRWGRGVPCNVIQARRQADQHIRTVRLCCCSCPVHGNNNCN